MLCITDQQVQESYITSKALLGSIPVKEDTVKTRSRVSRRILLDAIDGVLVLGGEFGLSSSLSSVNFVLEHLHGRIFLVSSRGRSCSSPVKFLRQFPASLVLEENWSTIVTNSNTSSVVDEDEIHEGQILSLDFGNFGISCRNIRHIERSIVPNVSEKIAVGAPLHRLNPSTTINFKKRFSKNELVAPWSVRETLVHSLDVSGEDANFEVAGSSSKEGVVRMPIHLQYGRLVLLNVFGHPPIVILLKIADGYNLSTAPNSKLVLLRRPLHMSGSTVNSKDDKSGLPLIVLEGPHVRITILRARHNAVGLWSPINSSYNLIVLSEFVLQLECGSLFGVDMDFVVIWAKGNL
jgi:hypothetical protein